MKIIILGSNGLVGKEVSKYLSKKHDIIKSDISILSFIILNYIRAIFLSGDYFLYLKYNENYKEEILSKYLKILHLY